MKNENNSYESHQCRHKSILNLPARMQWMWLQTREERQSEKVHVSCFINFLNPSRANCSSLMWYDLCFSAITPTTTSSSTWQLNLLHWKNIFFLRRATRHFFMFGKSHKNPNANNRRWRWSRSKEGHPKEHILKSIALASIARSLFAVKADCECNNRIKVKL